MSNKWIFLIILLFILFVTFLGLYIYNNKKLTKTIKDNELKYQSSLKACNAKAAADKSTLSKTINDNQLKYQSSLKTCNTKASADKTALEKKLDESKADSKTKLEQADANCNKLLSSSKQALNNQLSAETKLYNSCETNLQTCNKNLDFSKSQYTQCDARLKDTKRCVSSGGEKCCCCNEDGTKCRGVDGVDGTCWGLDGFEKGPFKCNVLEYPGSMHSEEAGKLNLFKEGDNYLGYVFNNDDSNNKNTEFNKTCTSSRPTSVNCCCSGCPEPNASCGPCFTDSAGCNAIDGGQNIDYRRTCLKNNGKLIDLGHRP